ncbi:MAG: tetratricopeptide repeat protein [Desulfuromonadaceae bacterium]|nr:tetratricopeptide repeat protein [Desulfuromonadaceae bacterium]
MPKFTNQDFILIEGAATYERILADVREVEAEEGLRHIQDFLKIYPDFARAHNDLAVMYYQAGNSLKALAHYEKAHKLDPGNITYRKNLADFYFVELEWTGEAIHTYLDILKDNPFDIEALNALGTISLQIGRKEQARQYFSRTLQLDSSNHDARQALQQLPSPASASDSVQIPQAPTQVSRAAETPPVVPATPAFQNLFNLASPESARSPEALCRDAISLVNADKPDEAIQLLEKVVAQDPNNALAHNDLGVLYQKRGDLQKSRQHHETAARLQPANTIYQKNLADLLCSEFGELEGALTIYVKLFAENRYDIELLKAIAQICLEVDKPDDARFFLERVVAAKPWDLEAGEALRAIKLTISGNI